MVPLMQNATSTISIATGIWGATPGDRTATSKVLSPVGISQAQRFRPSDKAQDSGVATRPTAAPTNAPINANGTSPSSAIEIRKPDNPAIEHVVVILKAMCFMVSEAPRDHKQALSMEPSTCGCRQCNKRGV